MKKQKQEVRTVLVRTDNNGADWYKLPGGRLVLWCRNCNLAIGTFTKDKLRIPAAFWFSPVYPPNQTMLCCKCADKLMPVAEAEAVAQ